MATIRVQRTIAAPIADVFEWLSTATNYTKNAGILRVKLVEPGEDGAWGNGAIREVATSGGWFREVISEHQPPHAFDYLVLKARPPLRHQGGQMRFAEVPGGTEVTWTSVFEVPSPIASASLGRAMARLGSKGFASLLRTAEKELTGAVAPLK